MEYIRLENITKVFGKVVANSHVSMSIEQGEVLSILGENGSGKTTLLNVLDGIYQQDEGKIFIRGEEVKIHSPRDAYAHGIGMVHQHFKLVEAFNAIENVVLGLSRKELLAIYQNLGEIPSAKTFPRASIKESVAYVQAMCARYGFSFDPYKGVHDMSVSEKQTLEIVKVLFRGVDTLILDEPTAVLTPQEIVHLFDVIRNMKKHGKTVIIITHKLNEVLEISDRIAILRKGEYVGTVKTSEATEASLADAMVGEKVELNIHRSTLPTTGDRLIVKNLSVLDGEGKKALDDVTFTLHGSEILGIAGISGSGQKDLLNALSGLAHHKSGEITFINPKKEKPVTFFHKDIKQIRELAKEGKFHFKDGTKADLTHIHNKKLIEMVNNEEIIFYEDEIIDLTTKKPIEIRDLGIKLSYVPEDRLGMGLVADMDIVDNMLLRSFRKGRGRLLKKEKPKELAEHIVEELGVVTPSLNTEVGKLSGGNIQKILVGREISSHPKILMVAYPVRGLDINSSYQIYNLLDEQKKNGTAIIYVGEDLDVLLAISDRILVLSGGKVAGIVDSRTTTKEELGLLMTKTVRKEESNETQVQA